jgi:hypothetical protein
MGTSPQLLQARKGCRARDGTVVSASRRSSRAISGGAAISVGGRDLAYASKRVSKL